MKKLVFAIALLTSAVSGFHAFAALEDAKGTVASEAVEYLENAGIVEGYEDGTFKPENAINRAEFLKIALKAANLVDESCANAEKKFRDVTPSDWFFRVICSATRKGIVEGYPDGTFKPGNTINFAEASKIVAKVNNLEITETTDDDWFTPFVKALNEARVIAETIQSEIKELSRGEMAQMIWGIKTGKEVKNETLGALPKITSCRELNIQLEKFQKRQSSGISGGRGMTKGVMMDFPNADALMAPMVAKEMSTITTSDARLPQYAENYSTTNIQEFGVDEADIIKNDGSHIYLIKNNTVRIIQAFPSENLKSVAILPVTDKNFNPREIYVDGNILTVIGEKYEYGGGDVIPMKNFESGASISSKMAIMPEILPLHHPSRQKSFTDVISYDISEKSSPKQIRKVGVEGAYLNSRKIGSVVYLTTNRYQNYRAIPATKTESADLPVIFDSANPTEKLVGGCADIHYFPNFEDPNYLIVSAIDTKNTTEKVGRTMLLGGGTQMYASAKNLYVLRESAQESFISEGEWNGWRYNPITEIYKFSLKGVQVDFVAKGMVEGHVLNQFSMNEDSLGFFRIATQVESAGSRVTILDENLQKTGEVAGIAPGENLKSARFMGNKAYLVTFKNVDPLFVIDLDPKNPKVLGKLKIPGWSDYLHPYDENHLIGLGKEVDESIDADKVHSENAIYYTAVLGLKMAIFDVSDIEHPKEMFKTVIGDRGTESEVLNNHKALLFDKKEGILALPISVMAKDKTAQYDNTRQVFNGAFVYDVDLKNGFQLRGKATHYPEKYWTEDLNNPRYGNYEFDVQRIIFIGDNFYTISPNIIEAHDWKTVAQKNRLVLNQKPCAEIYEPLECQENPSCKTVWKEWKECYTNNEDFSKICQEKQEFSTCREK